MDLNFEFWIITSDVSLRLPVTPKSYTFSVSNQMETVRATEFGDINIPTTMSPKSLSLSGFFTTNDYSFAKEPTASISKTFDYVTYVKNMCENKEVVRVIIACDTHTAVNEQFYVESITYDEDNTTNGDINYVIKLKEYKKLEAIKSSDVTVSSATREVSNVYTPKTYTVVSGDNLCKVARSFYGSADWQTIYNANVSVIGKNPNLIYPGQVLTIPSI